MHCEFLQARPYLHWIPLVPSQGNCLPVVFAGTASPPFGAELAAGAGLAAGGDVAGGDVAGWSTFKSPGCGINSSCCGAMGPAFPSPGIGSSGGFTIPCCKGGGGGTGGGIPGAPMGIDIALPLEAMRHAYHTPQYLNPAAAKLSVKT